MSIQSTSVYDSSTLGKSALIGHQQAGYQESQSGGIMKYKNHCDSFGMVFGLVARSLLLLLMFTTVIAASEKDDLIEKTGNVEGAAASNDEDSFIDWHKRELDSQVQRAAMWVDSFFQDPNYEAEVATSQLRIRPELHYRNEQGAKARLKFSLKLSLPNVNNRISLIAGHDPDEGKFEEAAEDPGDNSIVGLQFFGKIRRNWHLSLSAGFKFNDFAMFVGPRARFIKAFSERSSYRFTQTVRWQTNNYWQFNSRLDLNHAFNDRFFFRQTFYGRWRGEKSDEVGYRTRVSSFLTQRLKNLAGLQYEFTTIFHTQPDTHVDQYRLSLRFRKRTSREWLYYEIAPEVSFEDDFDYKANPGIRLRVEFFYGRDPAARFNDRELEDTDDFRW